MCFADAIVQSGKGYDFLVCVPIENSYQSIHPYTGRPELLWGAAPVDRCIIGGANPRCQAGNRCPGSALVMLNRRVPLCMTDTLRRTYLFAE